MEKSIGIVEFRSIAIGIGAVDTLVKAADVRILDAKTICPGKYYIIFAGSVSAVSNSLKVVVEEDETFIIDYRAISNVYPEMFAAINQATEISEWKAIGVVETLTSPSIMVAADAAVKATSVDLVEIRIARAIGGKNMVIINGDVSSVNESISAAIAYAEEKDFLVDYRVIASPHKDLYRAIM
ncbi:MAG: BMC domain-containing protein [Actinomycetota bacterium]|nr:BMC domain-containing protein [Actinomycetota bacterium]